MAHGRRLAREGACLLVALAPAVACSPPPSPSTAEPRAIVLPVGFQPEGIAALGRALYVGSIPTGDVWHFDARTGRGAPVVRGRPGRSAIGLAAAGGRLVVAGGATGQGYLYDAASEADLAVFDLGGGRRSFVNDVVVVGSHAFFTDSLVPVLHRVDLESLAVSELALSGDLRYEDGFNANGIVAAAGGDALVVVQTNTGRLFTVDPRTGGSRRVSLSGTGALPGGDGLLLEGSTLRVVQNRANRIAELRLATT